MGPSADFLQSNQTFAKKHSKCGGSAWRRVAVSPITSMVSYKHSWKYVSPDLNAACATARGVSLEALQHAGGATNSIRSMLLLPARQLAEHTHGCVHSSVCAPWMRSHLQK